MAVREHLHCHPESSPGAVPEMRSPGEIRTHMLELLELFVFTIHCRGAWLVMRIKCHLVRV